MAGVFMTGTGASTGAGMILIGAGGACFASSSEGVAGMAALKSAAKTSKGLSLMMEEDTGKRAGDGNDSASLFFSLSVEDDVDSTS